MVFFDFAKDTAQEGFGGTSLQALKASS